MRINPNELSISDPNFYNDIYVSESRRRTENYHSFVQGIDLDGEHISSTSSTLTNIHRISSAHNIA